MKRLILGEQPVNQPRAFVLLKSMQKPLLITALALGWSAASWATTINYTVTNEGGNNWEYAYTITNNSPLANFDVATIYFPTLAVADAANQFTNILASTLTQPAGWTADEYQQGAGAGGFVDFYAPTPLAAGASVSLLDVTFTYSGVGTPGSQYFEVTDNSFALLASGNTSIQSQSVPEPSTLLLFATGLLGMFARKRATAAA